MVDQRIECLDCGHVTSYHPMELACPACGSTWREARYDLDDAAARWKRERLSRPPTIWRYKELLPTSPLPLTMQLGEGGTPLIHASKLGSMIGLPHLYLKDERQNPTISFKDRQAAVNAAALLDAGIHEAVVASTGNVAISYSAYCARAGIKLWAFITSLVPAVKMHEIALFGTRMVKVTGTYDQAKRLAAEFADTRGLFLDRGARNIATIEAMKTMAFEIAEQLPHFLGSADHEPWFAPDWYIQAVSGGMGPIGVLKGFQELKAMGFTTKLPAIGAIQTDGCSPMVKAWKAGKSEPIPVEHPRTLISTLTTGNPGRSYTLLRERIMEGPGGAMESVTDEEAVRSMVILARTEGLSIEPAAAVALAGTMKLANEGIIPSDAVVVVNCSGHTIPIEHSQIPASWSSEVDMDTPEALDRPQEGLLAALTQLDQRRTKEILIVDDHAEARLLLQRILLSQGTYLIREAGSGPEALAEAKRNPPDLILLDLMMPEMDGFAVIDKLKEESSTAAIPIIVITAKTLTSEEEVLLEGQISRTITKGDLLDEELLDEVKRNVEDENP